MNNLVTHKAYSDLSRTLQLLEESLWIAETRFDKIYMDSILIPDFFEFGRSGRIYYRQDILNTYPFIKELLL